MADTGHAGSGKRETVHPSLAWDTQPANGTEKGITTLTSRGMFLFPVNVDSTSSWPFRQEVPRATLDVGLWLDGPESNFTGIGQPEFKPKDPANSSSSSN